MDRGVIGNTQDINAKSSKILIVAKNMGKHHSYKYFRVLSSTVWRSLAVYT